MPVWQQLCTTVYGVIRTYITRFTSTKQHGLACVLLFWLSCTMQTWHLSDMHDDLFYNLLAIYAWTESDCLILNWENIGGREGTKYVLVLQSQFVRKEGNVLFNDTLTAIWIRHMVKDHSDSERGNPLLPMCYSFWLAAKVLLYASFHRQDNAYHGLCYTSRGALAGRRI